MAASRATRSHARSPHAGPILTSPASSLPSRFDRWSLTDDERNAILCNLQATRPAWRLHLARLLQAPDLAFLLVGRSKRDDRRHSSKARRMAKVHQQRMAVLPQRHRDFSWLHRLCRALAQLRSGETKRKGRIGSTVAIASTQSA
jgi:hypothetical protein